MSNRSGPLTCVCSPLSDLYERWTRPHIQDPNSPESTRRRAGKRKSPSLLTNHWHVSPKLVLIRFSLMSASLSCALTQRGAAGAVEPWLQSVGGGVQMDQRVKDSCCCCCWGGGGGEDWESFLSDFQQLNASSGSPLCVRAHTPSLSTPHPYTHLHVVPFSVSLLHSPETALLPVKLFLILSQTQSYIYCK